MGKHSRRKMMRDSAMLGAGLLGLQAIAETAPAKASAQPQPAAIPLSSPVPQPQNSEDQSLRSAAHDGPLHDLNGHDSYDAYKKSLVEKGMHVPPVAIDADNPSLLFYDYLCQYCGHCDRGCLTQGVAHCYESAKRKDKNRTPCIQCGQCLNRCNRGAIWERMHYVRVRDMMGNPANSLIVSTAPAVRISLAEAFGHPAGTDFEGKMVAALRQIGFRHVLDLTFGADMTITEEASELVRRLREKSRTPAGTKEIRMPLFTSCCPAWVSFAEQFHPDILPHLSTAKSPLMMQGAAVKTWFAEKNGLAPEAITHVAVTPCTAKKYEILRPEMNAAGRRTNRPSIRDVDYALTTRELAQWIFEHRIRMDNLAGEKFDSLMGRGSGAGVIFGNTGGVTEGVLRTAWTLITGQKPPQTLLQGAAVRGIEGVREVNVTLGEIPLRIAIISGTGNVRPVLDRLRRGEVAYDFVEVMACPGGCAGGAGQPKDRGFGRPNDALRQARIAGLYRKESDSSTRSSLENPEIRQFYQDFLGKPLGPSAMQLMHTTYENRSPTTS